MDIREKDMVGKWGEGMKEEKKRGDRIREGGQEGKGVEQWSQSTKAEPPYAGTVTSAFLPGDQREGCSRQTVEQTLRQQRWLNGKVSIAKA